MERKRKQQLIIFPRSSTLTSENAYGKRLLEKMGWSTGKGLGANLQGMAEPLRMEFKNDYKGLGFQENENQWAEHQITFDKLLLDLNGGERDNQNESISSLEEKSVRSRSRLNYRKFARGKDLSKCSEKDFACILGKHLYSDSKPGDVSNSINGSNEPYTPDLQVKATKHKKSKLLDDNNDSNYSESVAEEQELLQYEKPKRKKKKNACAEGYLSECGSQEEEFRKKSTSSKKSKKCDKDGTEYFDFTVLKVKEKKNKL